MNSNVDLQVESLRHITELSQKAVRAENRVAVIDLPKEPPSVYGIVLPDGTFEKQFAEPQPRGHQLLSVDQVEAIVSLFAAVDIYMGDGGTRKTVPAVWVSPEAVIVLEDNHPESLRQSRAVCKLRKTPEFEFLTQAARQETWKQQKEFLRLLKITLADAMGESLESLVTILRTVKFSGKTEASGNVQRGRESYGRAIEAEVFAESGQIPEEVTLKVRVFDDPALKIRYPIRVALEIDTTANAFALIPSQQSITNLMDEALAGIMALYQDLDCSLFLGTP